MIIALSVLTTFAQSGPEINPDGIIFPRLVTPPFSNVSTKGQIIYNTTLSKFQTFNGTSWVDLVPSQNDSPSTLVDDDGDSMIKFGENFTSLDPD